MILTIIFWVLLVLFMFKTFSFAFSMAWELFKTMLTSFLFPLILIILVISGLVALAVPLLAIV